MPSFNQVKGLAAVTVAEGKKLGEVEQLLIDPDAKQVKWLLLREGRVGGTHHYVAAEAVRAIGPHAVIVNSESDVKTPAEAPEAEDLYQAKRFVVGNKLVTDKGNYVGRVSDYDFADTLKLTDIRVSTWMFAKPLFIPAEQVMTIGKDVMIVAASAIQNSEKQEQKQEQPG